VFGSYATGLYLPTSDIDVVIKHWEFDAQTPDVMQKALMTLEKQLINKGAYDDVKVIRTSVSHFQLVFNIAGVCAVPLSCSHSRDIFYCKFDLYVLTLVFEFLFLFF
jgi:hypothetical protein